MPAVQNEESFVFLPQVVPNYISKYLIASDLWPWHLTLCGFLQNTSFTLTEQKTWFRMERQG